jgi:hypothetical protein
MHYQTHTGADGVKSIAGFGPEGIKSEFRYTLARYWHGHNLDLFSSFTDVPALTARTRLTEVALFIMLNPSTADALKNDPTVAKCIRLAKAWGFGGVLVRNIFAYRSTDPNGLKICSARGLDPVGGELNDRAIMEAVRDERTGVIVAAWGNHGKYRGRSKRVREMLTLAERPVYAFKISGEGEPEHPLYQKEGVSPDEGMVRYL